MALFESPPTAPLDPSELARGISQVLQPRREELIDLCRAETGMTQRDSEESIDGCFLFLERFKSHRPPVKRESSIERLIEIHPAPWGTILVILPQNAFLYLGLVTLLHGLACRNRMVLKAPSGSPGTAAILSQAIREAGLDPARAEVVTTGAKQLLDGFLASPSPGLVHYFGSSGRIPDLAADCYRAGKGFIADGEGNTWVYVDEGCDPEYAAEILAAGATRYNGQTCTSVNGAIVHPSVYRRVFPLLRGKLTGAEVGSEEAAAQILETLKAAGGEVLCGGVQDGSYLEPTVITDPDFGSGLVREGVFGPAMWIAAGDDSDFRRLWPSNRYPLCAAVLGPSVDPSDWVGLPNLARLVINGDPSVEDPLEPWGGYPASGNSRVSSWQEKYTRTVQVDRP
jgi:acyl-CoA reductase-like NAD-dependent aldehyde dehydrogenase